MNKDVVLVRAYRGQPLQMVATGRAPGLVYASNPRSLDRVKAGETRGVGFPEEDVFCYDPGAHARLEAMWIAGGDLERRTWRELGLSRYCADTEAL